MIVGSWTKQKIGDIITVGKNVESDIDTKHILGCDEEIPAIVMRETTAEEYEAYYRELGELVTTAEDRNGAFYYEVSAD